MVHVVLAYQPELMPIGAGYTHVDALCAAHRARIGFWRDLEAPTQEALIRTLSGELEHVELVPGPDEEVWKTLLTDPLPDWDLVGAQVRSVLCSPPPSADPTERVEQAIIECRSLLAELERAAHGGSDRLELMGVAMERVHRLAALIVRHRPAL